MIMELRKLEHQVPETMEQTGRAREVSFASRAAGRRIDSAVRTLTHASLSDFESRELTRFWKSKLVTARRLRRHRLGDIGFRLQIA